MKRVKIIYFTTKCAFTLKVREVEADSMKGFSILRQSLGDRPQVCTIR